MYPGAAEFCLHTSTTASSSGSPPSVPWSPLLPRPTYSQPLAPLVEATKIVVIKIHQKSLPSPRMKSLPPTLTLLPTLPTLGSQQATLVSHLSTLATHLPTLLSIKTTSLIMQSGNPTPARNQMLTNIILKTITL